MNNSDNKRKLLLIGLVILAVIVVISFIISEFFIKKTPQLPELLITQVSPKEDINTTRFPSQQVAFTFNAPIDLTHVIYSIDPDVPVKINYQAGDEKIVLFTPQTTWKAGITTITILPQTRSLQGNLLAEPFTYRLKSAFPENPPPDLKGY